MSDRAEKLAAENVIVKTENGIAETRTLVYRGAEVVAARLHWPGELAAGVVVTAKLVAKPSGATRGRARLDDGTDILIDNLAPGLTQGEHFPAQILRAAIAERGRYKLAQARVHEAKEAGALHGPKPGGPALRAADKARIVRDLGQDWSDIWQAASTGEIAFAGGAIVVSTTPAMTVIDIDGDGPPRAVALASVPAIARAIGWFDLAGNIGIDFPTIPAKKDRVLVDEALANALADWPHERTAMNGFGFVQLVAKLEGPSLLHRFAASRTGMCARYALRMAERIEGAGLTLLTVHPALMAAFKTAWLDELQRRTGRALRIETDPALALETPHAQLLAQ